MGQTEVVTLPRIDSYSPLQTDEARATSTAWARYELLLSEPGIDDLHRDRHRAWMECVLATYFKTADTQSVCAHWSAVADRLLANTWKECGLDQQEVLLCALGKHGAQELNLSSDIDLIIVADPREALSIERNLRRFQQRLQQSGEFGFCYRLDFDLRPGGTMGPILTTPSQFQDHYWSQGETWERLALVRLRPLVGSITLSEQVHDLAKRFSYRKFLDFTLLEDLKALRSQVHQKGFERMSGELHLKLEVGGIRDIELFTHSLQVLHGGKLPELQTRSTTEALTALSVKGLLPAREAEFLKQTYWQFRHVENLVQSVDDRQTHVLKDNAAPLPAMTDRPEINQHLREVDQIVSSLLGQVDLQKIHLPVGLEAQKKWLADLKFPESCSETWEQLINATALSHKNERDERARQEFLYVFITQLARHTEADRALGLNILLDFVRATRGKATFFSMLLRSPNLIADLARLFCLSPYLGAILAARPELLDHFVLQVDDKWSADPQVLQTQMSERKLLTEIWSANQFLSDGDLPSLYNRTTDTADAISIQLLKNLKGEFPNSQLELIALGKWGGRELGLRSDLDFIFVTPSEPCADDFKVARRFISRVVYDVDLRLRPSGQSGPLLVTHSRLNEYWRAECKPWERQAYLRARSLSPQISLDKAYLVTRALSPEELVELRGIREKLLRPISKESLDLKYAHGGLIDIELGIQTAILRGQNTLQVSDTLGMIQHLKSSYPQWEQDGSHLAALYAKLRTFEQMLQLASSHRTTEVVRSGSGFVKAASLLGMDYEEAWTQLEQALDEAKGLLSKLELHFLI